MVNWPTDALASTLLKGRNTDGGWAYHPGKASRLEPTCWALIALRGKGPDPASLTNWPAESGLLLERPHGTPNYAFHALALLTMEAWRIEHSLGASTLIKALQRAQGKELPPSTINSQNNSIRAWSWIEGTFSWVEPTAWAVLALKKWAHLAEAGVDRDRLETGERLLIDRCCTTGGWNYGNANMLGQQLKAFVPTTAIALLALQDRPSLPEVQRSVTFLEDHAIAEPSGQALALALLALRAFKSSRAAAVEKALEDQLNITLALGNQTSIALALYSMEAKTPHAVLLSA